MDFSYRPRRFDLAVAPGAPDISAWDASLHSILASREV